MSAVAGFINSKIVPFTGNRATEPFIGKAIHPKESNGRPVFMIAETGYVLTLEEFKMFVRAGIIDRPNRPQPKPQPKVTVQPSPTRAARSQNPVKAPTYMPPARAMGQAPQPVQVPRQAQQTRRAEAAASTAAHQSVKPVLQAQVVEPRQAQQSRRAEPMAASKAAAATVASMAQPAVAIPRDPEPDIIVPPLHGAMGDMTEVFETSQFLKEYTNPQFEFGEPKHHRMLEAGEKFREGMTGFFDKIGFSAKESIVNGLK